MPLSLPLLLSLTFTTLSASQQLYSQPVVGILTFPSTLEPTFTSFFDNSYVQWLEQSGARVAPIPYDIAADDLKTLYDQLNGILFTGGAGQPMDNDTYFNTASKLFEMVTTDPDNTTPLWGTCLGFETISTIVAGSNPDFLSNFDAENLALPLDFTAESLSSAMYNPDNMPLDVYTTLGYANVTTNWHTFGVTVSDFDDVLMPQGLVKLSTNVDRDGKEFVSSMEMAGKPVFATQWHPESNQFDWADKAANDATPDRSEDSVRAMQWQSSFFVHEARKNDKRFESEEEFEKWVLGEDKDSVMNDGWRYFFKRTSAYTRK